MEIPVERAAIPAWQATTGQDHQTTDTGRQAAVDELTTAILTGASKADIERLEESAEYRQPAGESAAIVKPEQEEPREIAGDFPPGPSQEPVIPKMALAPMEEFSQEVQALESQAEGIERLLSQADANGGTSNPEVAALIAGYHQLMGELALARERESVEREFLQEEYRARREGSMRAATELYGDLNDRNSALWREVNRITNDPAHPDHDPDLLRKANAPVKIAKLAAANLGIVANGADRAWDASLDAMSQPGSRVRPAAATKQTSPPPPRKSAQDLMRDSEQAALAAVEGSMPPAGVQRAQRPYVRL